MWHKLNDYHTDYAIFFYFVNNKQNKLFNMKVNQLNMYTRYFKGI